MFICILHSCIETSLDQAESEDYQENFEDEQVAAAGNKLQ